MSQPQIFLLSLEFQNFFDESYASLIDGISKVAKMQRAKSRTSALRYLDANSPKVIIITDQGLTIRANKPVLDKVVTYVKNGGTVIVGLEFCGNTNMDAFNKFFHSFGLPWSSGDYHRTDFGYNPSSILHPGVNTSSFPPPYSMKVLHVKNALPTEKIFVPLPNAQTQSMVFAPALVDESQAAVVGAKIGEGYLYYCGDVSSEAESDKVILTLCGL